MRRSRTRRGSGRKARKSYWIGASLSIANVDFANAGFGEVATGWMKWPSGLLNFQTENPTEQNEGFIEPNDETLVRTIVSANCTLNLHGLVQLRALYTGVFGIIAWDAYTSTAVDLDSAVQPSGVVPNPARDMGADWIIRLPFSFTRDNFSIGNIAETFIVSRAMRKLPPRTGLLGCFGFEALLAPPDDVTSFDLQADIRMLMKSGYYSI